ncbi:hypothetical protein ACP275_03G074600 [Erythranthe tilingii]
MGSVGFDGEDESQPSTSTGKKYKLPRTILDGCGAVSHASVPRKLRSAVKKRGRESVTIIPLPVSRKKHHVSNGVETLGKKYSTKKPKQNKKKGKITKDEEEVAEALYALSGMFFDSNKINQTGLDNEVLEAKSPAIHNSVEDTVIPTPKEESNRIGSKSTLGIVQNSPPEIVESQSDLSLVPRPRISPCGEHATELRQAATSGIQYDKNYPPMDIKNNKGLFPSPPQSSKPQESGKRIPPWFEKANSAPAIENNSSTTEKVVVESNKSWKRSTAHVYISRLIQVLQLSEKNEGLIENNKPTQVITCDDRNDSISFAPSAEIQNNSAETRNEFLNKRPVQDRPESSASCSRKQNYDFLALGSGVCGLDGRKGVNGAVHINEQFYMQSQNHSAMLFLPPPQNGYSSTFHAHNSALAPQQVQIPQNLNSSLTSQLQTWYNGGGRDAPSMVNYAHTIFPHVHAALASKYQQFSSQHQHQHNIMAMNSSLNVKKHHHQQYHNNTTHQENLRLGFERNGAVFYPENVPQFQLSCNQQF